MPDTKLSCLSNKMYMPHHYVHHHPHSNHIPSFTHIITHSSRSLSSTLPPNPGAWVCNVSLHAYMQPVVWLLGKLACHPTKPLRLLVQTAEPAKKPQRQPLQSITLSCAMLPDDSHMRPYNRVQCMTVGHVVSCLLLDT